MSIELKRPRFYLDAQYNGGRRPSSAVEVHRFYGRIVYLPAKKTGDVMYGNSPYTDIQVEALRELVLEKMKHERLMERLRAEMEERQALNLGENAP